MMHYPPSPTGRFSVCKGKGARGKARQWCGAVDLRNATIRKDRRFRPGLRAHLIGLVLAVLLPALTVAAGAAWHLADSYRHAFEARLQDTARAMALFLDSEVETHLAT